MSAMSDFDAVLKRQILLEQPINSLTYNMFGPFWSPPYPGGAGEPLPTETKPVAPAQCSKCKEPFPYEAHESGKCYRCRNET